MERQAGKAKGVSVEEKGVQGKEKEVSDEGGSQREAKAGLPGHPGHLALELVEKVFRLDEGFASPHCKDVRATMSPGRLIS